MPTGTTDYLIVGFGIAGVCLWRELERRGRSFVIADAADVEAASRVAPGVINPLAGKRLNPSWKVDEQLPAALELYRALEQELGQPLLHTIPIIRILKDQEQRDVFDRRKQGTASRYVGQEHPAGRWPRLLKDPFGSFSAAISGHLDVATTVRLAREHLISRGLLIEGRCQSQELELDGDTVIWRGDRYKRVIFCEGWRGHENRWFGDLPYKPAKGEMLTLRSKTELHGFPQAIVNCGKWVLPIGGDRYRAGSTYSWESFDAEPTEEGRKTILEAVSEFVEADFEVLDQSAGVRPIMKDYRPVLGTHPDAPNIAIFNGLGSKGVLAAPWLAQQLVAHIEDGLPIREMDVKRFYRKKSK